MPGAFHVEVVQLGAGPHRGSQLLVQLHPIKLFGLGRVYWCPLLKSYGLLPS